MTLRLLNWVMKSSDHWSAGYQPYCYYCSFIHSSKIFRRSDWLKAPANSSWPTDVDQNWKMRVINHRSDGIFDVRRMVCWPGNEAPWALYHTRGDYLVVYLRGNKKSGVHGYPKTKYMWLNLKISDQNWTKQMQEYLNHIARKMLPTFWGLSARKKHLSISWKRAEKYAKDLEKGWEKESLLTT